MIVGIDHPRHNAPAAQIDHPRAGTVRRNASRRPDSRDPVASNDDRRGCRPTGIHRRNLAVVQDPLATGVVANLREGRRRRQNGRQRDAKHR
jgi:hypothetical protein